MEQVGTAEEGSAAAVVEMGTALEGAAAAVEEVGAPMQKEEVGSFVLILGFVILLSGEINVTEDFH